MIDETSLKILRILQKKARIPNVEVARQMGMAPSAVLERIRKLEKQGIIQGYEVRLNPKRFDRNLVAFITVTMESTADQARLGKKLALIPEVQEVHFVAGEDSLLVKVRASGTGELGTILRQKIAANSKVMATRTAVVLETHKETATIPITHEK
jgi:Lrp/AsnC family transcriptional regulator, leucine-responsive regulatory protein